MIQTALRTVFALSLAALPMLASCSSTRGHDQAESTASTMEDLRAALVSCKTGVEAVGNALKDVAAKAEVDPKPGFEAFSKSLKGLESSNKKLASVSAELQKRGQGYMSEWEKRSASIVDEDIKEADAKRRGKLSEALKEVADAVGAVDKELTPALALMGDLRTALDNDLTPSGIDSLSSSLKKSGKGGGAVIEAIDDALETIDEVKVQFQTAKPPPAQKPAK